MRFVLWATLVATSLYAGVEDDAQLFSKNAVSRANKTLATLKDKTGKEIFFLTVKDLQSKSFAIYLRDEAMKRKPNGAIILVAVKPPQFDIVSGRQTALVLTQEKKAELKERISKKLRKAPDATLIEVADYFAKLFKDAAPGLVVADSYEMPKPVVEATAGLPANFKWILCAVGVLFASLLCIFLLRPMYK